MRTILLVLLAIAIAVAVLVLLIFIDLPFTAEEIEPGVVPETVEEPNNTPEPEPILPAAEVIETTGLDLLSTLALNPRFSELEAALVATGLDQTLQTGEYTVFAPSDEDIRNAADTNSLDELRNILAAHVIEGQYSSSDLATEGSVTTLAGNTIVIQVTESGGTVNGVPVPVTDFYTETGVIHFVAGIIPLATH